ncbi:MAG: cbb3-type cytochrome c oxidase N-terminal domain-containing protein [Bacteroidota bacterium]
MINTFKKIAATSSGLLFVAVAFAQNAAATTPAAPVAAKDNSMMYLLVASTAILLVAILLLGNTMVTLTKLVLDKRGKVASTLLLLLTFSFSQAQDAATTAAPAVASTAINIDMDLWAGILVLSLEILVMLWMLLRVRALLNELSDKKEEVKQFEFHFPILFDNLNASVPIEKEKDILLDHNYDGIRELDNSLPPWWKYSFYISIVWSIGYLGYFYFGGGPSSKDEYTAEVLQAKVDVEEFNRKNVNNVDESNVKLADASGITEGVDIFKTNCIACHGNAGEGNAVGPNLTDNYWLHGGALNDVFKSVKYGWPAKGMKSWQTDLSNTQIRNVASYIQSIHGSNPPNAKEPQGDLFTEVGTVASDTISVKIDSTQKVSM